MSSQFDELARIVARLRAPNGCPWDAEQTHESLKPYVLEETYEVLEAIDDGDTKLLREELGDLLLQVLLHAQIEAERGQFTINEVMSDLVKKLVRRHPHVFTETSDASQVANADHVVKQWDRIKQEERNEKGLSGSILDGIPSTLPALFRASQIQGRASRVGFDWDQPTQVVDKLDEELEELRNATKHGRSHTPDAHSDGVNENVEEEFGDVLFTVANLARFLHINPEEALRKSSNRFTARFRRMETFAREAGKELTALSPAEWDTMWERAKQLERTLQPDQP